MKTRYDEPGADISGPGYHRMRRRMGDAAYEAMRQDTLRRQEAALRDVVRPTDAIARPPTRRDDEYPLPQSANPARPGPCLAVHADYALHEWVLRHTRPCK